MQIPAAFEYERATSVENALELLQARGPEARLLAGAKLQVEHEMAADERRARPAFDLEIIKAYTAPLASGRWRNPAHYCSDADDDRDAAPREEILDD